MYAATRLSQGGDDYGEQEDQGCASSGSGRADSGRGAGASTVRPSPAATSSLDPAPRALPTDIHADGEDELELNYEENDTTMDVDDNAHRAEQRKYHV
eukprot:jgi/Tetstr1/434373/TSEL_023474.t1